MKKKITVYTDVMALETYEESGLFLAYTKEAWELHKENLYGEEREIADVTEFSISIIEEGTHKFDDGAYIFADDSIAMIEKKEWIERFFPHLSFVKH